MVENGKRSLPSLTGLRFFAAFLICLAHVIPYVIPHSSLLFPQLAGEGMTLFFVLSGFVIHYNYSATLKENPKLGMYNFVISRFARLYPLFFICLCFFLLSDINKATLPATFDQTIPYYLTLTESWFYITIGSHTLIYQFGDIPSVFWSISTEWFFYLVYPLISFTLLKMSKIRTKIIIFLIILICMPILIAKAYFLQLSLDQFAMNRLGSGIDMTKPQDSFFRWLVYFSPYFRISEFLIGCLTAAIYMQLSERLPSKKEEGFGFFILFLAITSIPVLHYLIFHPPVKLLWMEELHRCFGFAPTMAIIMFCCVRYNNIITRLACNPILILGGEMSYSLYLLHLPIAAAFSYNAPHTYSWILTLGELPRTLLTFACIFGIAFISYNLIEIPMRRILRRWLMVSPVYSVL